MILGQGAVIGPLDPWGAEDGCAKGQKTFLEVALCSVFPKAMIQQAELLLDLLVDGFIFKNACGFLNSGFCSGDPKGAREALVEYLGRTAESVGGTHARPAQWGRRRFQSFWWAPSPVP